jgi:hypothetical protein
MDVAESQSFKPRDKYQKMRALATRRILRNQDAILDPLAYIE